MKIDKKQYISNPFRPIAHEIEMMNAQPDAFLIEIGIKVKFFYELKSAKEFWLRNSQAKFFLCWFDE